jgi:hypothetical protein
MRILMTQNSHKDFGDKARTFELTVRLRLFLLWTKDLV